MNKKKAVYTSLTALALASFSATTFADEVNTATEEVSVTLADEAVAEDTVVEASPEVAATETVAEEESATATATNLYEETAVAEKPAVDYTYFAGEWEHKDSGIYEGTVSTDGSATLPLLANGNYVPKGGTYQELGLDADGKIALIDVIADQDMIIASGWKFTRKGAAQTEETATEPATADIDYAYFAGQWEALEVAYIPEITADGTISWEPMKAGHFVKKGEYIGNEVIAEEDQIYVDNIKFTRVPAGPDHAYFADEWVDVTTGDSFTHAADGTNSQDYFDPETGHKAVTPRTYVKKGETYRQSGADHIAEEDLIITPFGKFTRKSSTQTEEVVEPEKGSQTEEVTESEKGSQTEEVTAPEKETQSQEEAVSPATTTTAIADTYLDATLASGQWADGKGVAAIVTADAVTLQGLSLSNPYYVYVPAGETYNFVEGLIAYKRTADTDLILVSAGGDTLAVLTRVAEERPASEETGTATDAQSDARNDLLTTIDKSSLTAEQKSALAEKVAVAETAEELAGIQAEVETLIGAGGAASAADKSEETTGKTSDKAVSTTAKGAGQVAASSTSTPSYSRVARAQAEKALPKTGEATSILGLIGLGLTTFGTVVSKRRK